MKRTKRILSASVMLLLVAVVYILYSSNGFSSKRIHYTGFYEDIRGLQESSPIYYKGVKVGAVEEIDLNIRKKVKVIFSIDKNLRLTEDTRAVITTDEVSGSKAVTLEPGSSRNIVAPGGRIPTAIDSTMVESFHAKISPVLYNGKSLLNYSDSALQSVNDLIVNGLAREIRLDLRSFKKTLNNLEKSSAAASSKTLEFQKTIGRLDRGTTQPSQINEQVNARISNAVASSKKAASKPVEADLKKLGNSLNKLSVAIHKAGENKHLNSKEAYYQASHSADSLNRSLQEFKENPPPFIKILSPGK